MNEQEQARTGGKSRKLFSRKLLLIVGPLLVVLIGVKVYQKYQASAKLQATTRELAVTYVSVVRPQRQDADMDIVLPGTVQAFMETPIYARTDGYLKHWYFDIGAQVKKGDLLAEIEAPEVDQQLRQARATLEQSQADLALAQTTADRWAKMLTQDAVSKQAADEKIADLAAKKAAVDANLANVQRLQDTQSFEKIYAPFDGVITSRKIDVGALISAGSTSSVVELFRMAEVDVLRIYVNVPERYSGSVQIGTTADLSFASQPNEKVTGKVVRTANAIDPQSLTMLTEIDVNNPDGKLLPGGYAQVTIKVHMQTPPLLVPVNTLIFRAEGPQVGVVDQQNRVKLIPVKIERDFGNKLEISGVSENDQVILNPSDSLSNGQQVEIVKP